MKGNREQIYEFVKLHSFVNANHGISTNEIAEALGMQRTNVSTALGELLREGRVKKSSSRPVLYSLTEAFADEEGAFRELVGYDGSLKYAVQLARAALLYPHRGLNVLLIGREGSGRKYMAEVMHKAAVQQGLVAEQAPFVMCDCMDFGADDAATIAELFGDGVQGGMLAEAATGILFLHKIQFLSVNVRRKLLRCFVEAEDARELPMIFLSCDDKALDVISLLEDHVLAEIRLPSLTERPLLERRKLLEHFLVAEACRTKRTITLESEVLTCLMLFPCEKEILTLKTQIRKACMNAYLRDYMDHGGELHLYTATFDAVCAQGILKLPRGQGGGGCAGKTADALFLSGRGRDGTCTGNAACRGDAGQRATDPDGRTVASTFICLLRTGSRAGTLRYHRGAASPRKRVCR